MPYSKTPPNSQPESRKVKLNSGAQLSFSVDIGDEAPSNSSQMASSICLQAPARHVRQRASFTKKAFGDTNNKRDILADGIATSPTDHKLSYDENEIDNNDDNHSDHRRHLTFARPIGADICQGKLSSGSDIHVKRFSKQVRARQSVDDDREPEQDTEAIDHRPKTTQSSFRSQPNPQPQSPAPVAHSTRSQSENHNQKTIQQPSALPAVEIQAPPNADNAEHTTINTASESPHGISNNTRNVENGGLTQREIPSKNSLLAKFNFKFARRNRVGVLNQQIVPAISGPPATSSIQCLGWLQRVTFDTSANYFYYWLAIISTAYIYNLLVVVARSVFAEMSDDSLWALWLSLDCFADSIYLADMFVRGRTGFLEQGLLICDSRKIFGLYLRSEQFKHDLASIFPLDYFLFVASNKKFAFLRFNRLLRHERLQNFMEQTETRSALPNAFRVGVVVWYIAIIIHWNACFYFYISERIGLGSDGWVYGWRNEQSLPKGVPDSLMRRYIYSFYWSTLILTTIGEVPAPQINIEYAFVTVDLMCGVLIFATIVGNVGSMISNMSAARTDFQSRIDNIKRYMELNRVGKQLEVRVIKWFDYLWANKQNLADQQVLKVLPDKLQAEIAMHVHFETLRKVRIFQDCEAGLLAELVLKLQLQVFSPMDYVCRKGDIGREMYIVKRGMIQVVSDDGNKVFATLSEGAVFGELSILNIAGSKNGNRRTANVRSVGYTDLFVLNKTELWVALREYPDARKVLIRKGRELLKKDNLLDESAPEDNKTAEEIADDLQASIRILQTRVARLTAEHANTETKLQERIAYLERKLGKYGVVLTRAVENVE